MANLTFKELVAAVSQLSPAQKAVLIRTLQEPFSNSPTREQLIAETEAMRAAGAFDHVESLSNKYVSPVSTTLTDEELRATIHDATTEWEKELDELYSAED